MKESLFQNKIVAKKGRGKKDDKRDPSIDFTAYNQKVSTSKKKRVFK
ncbi:hypothetical protein DNO_0044 [Dichelobacter nodosus VCS1703A]|uniref:Uncharacterized protein n=1 Tax=Dichelobacter nodosus (strain VCS1703A) TaxID=246195 RepID=A5EWW1_DICNV|nr:hypothetical protein DNO_0044 [Dichelobacter nodosus VCS1703A]